MAEVGCGVAEGKEFWGEGRFLETKATDPQGTDNSTWFHSRCVTGLESEEGAPSSSSALYCSVFSETLDRFLLKAESFLREPNFWGKMPRYKVLYNSSLSTF